MTSRPLVTPRVVGSTGSVEQQLLAGFGSTALVLVVAAFAYAELSSVRASLGWVDHTLAVIGQLHDVQTTVLDAEMERCAALRAGREPRAAPLADAAVRARSGLKRLRSLTSDNDDQQARLGLLESTLEAEIADLGRSRDEGAPATGAAATVDVPRGGGDDHLGGTRILFDEMLATEQGLLQMREMVHRRTLRSTAAVIGGGSLAAFLLGIAANVGIRRGVVERKRNQELIEDQAVRLEAQTRTLVDNEQGRLERIEELRVVNRKLDDQVHELTAAKAESERALAELRTASVALEKANRDLEHFAYVASHDLKAPLRGIASVSDWLEEELAAVMSAQSKELLHLLQGRVLRMEALIEGLLVYSRSARTNEPAEPIELAPFLRDLVSDIGPIPRSMSIEIADELPRIVVQKRPFRQVWIHLLSNALKHAAVVGAVVRLDAKDAGDQWELSVSDNGPGIEARYHERIFRIFHTLASRDKVEGSGMGLAIVKKLVDDRGGRVWVESEPGKGAKFCFTWPKE